ncbi:MAG: DUF4430 domain-containing protein [Ruminococcus sp.]|nr:DUF4430 domain-containing protein [Ruminococcus sp.]
MQAKFKSTGIISLLLCMMLIVATAFSTTGCGEKKDSGSQTDSSGSQSSESSESAVTEIGEGKTEFSFCVVDKDGNESQFLVRTDKEIVGEALIENNLIEGEDGDYGLYVKTVNGITADFDKDKTYWAFYVNGEYASSGVDTTKIVPGETYMFRVEK